MLKCLLSSARINPVANENDLSPFHISDCLVDLKPTDFAIIEKLMGEEDKQVIPDLRTRLSWIRQLRQGHRETIWRKQCASVVDLSIHEDL